MSDFLIGPKTLEFSKNIDLKISTAESYFLPNKLRTEIGLSYSDYSYLPSSEQSLRSQLYLIKLGYGF